MFIYDLVFQKRKMCDTKNETTFFAKIRHINDISLMVTIPQSYVREMDLKKDQDVIVTIKKVDLKKGEKGDNE